MTEHSLLNKSRVIQILLIMQAKMKDIGNPYHLAIFFSRSPISKTHKKILGVNFLGMVLRRVVLRPVVPFSSFTHYQNSKQILLGWLHNYGGIKISDSLRFISIQFRHGHQEAVLV